MVLVFLKTGLLVLMCTLFLFGKDLRDEYKKFRHHVVYFCSDKLILTISVTSEKAFTYIIIKIIFRKTELFNNYKLYLCNFVTF